MLRHFALLTLGAAALAQAPKPAAPAADPDANAPASSPAQNRQPKQLPPPGVAIPEKDRAELAAGVEELGKAIAELKHSKLPGSSGALIPDVEIFHKAVDWPLRYNEFYNVKDVGTARALLKEGMARAAALREGKAPWTTATGSVVRGYRSTIDGSVQPYGVVVPASWSGPDDKKPRATWIWNHGRGENLTELSFINGAMKGKGEFSPDDTFVVHPYGRYCNATKFAGEMDVFEALAAAERAYPVDQSRLVNAGFSMGGASAWHLGVHHAGLWAVSHAGAGFAETAEYAGVFSAGKTPPPWWEQILWRWYDATVCVANFTNSPMLAYHGSEDKQGQSTVIMKRFAEKDGGDITEFVGPGVAHKYEPNTKKEIAAKIAGLLADGARKATTKGRIILFAPMQDPAVGPFTIHRLEKTWERGELDFESDLTSAFKVQTKNIADFSYRTSQKTTHVIVDGESLQAVAAAGSPQTYAFQKEGGKWRILPDPVAQRAGTKSDGVTGPIDHAFMSSFVFVKPTGAPLTPALGAWTKRELDHAIAQWRGIFRGDAPVVDDTRLSNDQIKSSNLVLWGDPSSNAVFKKIADKLPVKWTGAGVEFGGKKYSATCAPILIFPNPLNPQKYVVLNSGFTFNRAAASGTNSQQTPKLPDWAIVDTSVPPDDKFPGKIEDAGFFDGQWKFTTERPK